MLPASPVSEASTRARFFQPELDALRLIAFLMVWLCHTLPTATEALSHKIAPVAAAITGAVQQAGNLGVPIFFFLSAYLITELLRRERQVTGSIHLRAFYIRRILRIWPLYLGVLAVYGVLGLRFHLFRMEPGRLLASLLMAGNWYLFFHPSILTPMRALWSLSVEEQFYLAWPLLGRHARPRAFLVVCAAIFAASCVTLLYLAQRHTPALHITAWVHSLVQFQYFALGGAAAVLLSGRIPRPHPAIRILLLLAAVAALFSATGVCGIKQPVAAHPAPALIAGYSLAGLGCTLLFFSLLGLPPRLIPAWARKLGQVSFGLYVFHETGYFLADTLQRHFVPARLTDAHFVLSLVANKLLSLVLTVAMALASYAWWEKPFLRLKERFAPVHSREA